MHTTHVLKIQTCQRVLMVLYHLPLDPNVVDLASKDGARIEHPVRGRAITAVPALRCNNMMLAILPRADNHYHSIIRRTIAPQDTCNDIAFSETRPGCRRV